MWLTSTLVILVRGQTRLVGKVRSSNTVQWSITPHWTHPPFPTYLTLNRSWLAYHYILLPTWIGFPLSFNTLDSTVTSSISAPVSVSRSRLHAASYCESKFSRISFNDSSRASTGKQQPRHRTTTEKATRSPLATACACTRFWPKR